MEKNNTNEEITINVKIEQSILKNTLLPKYCLICYSEISLSSSPSTIQTPGDQSSKFLLKQLNVVFILRNLLQVPVDKLEKYLKDFGNPDKWAINLCDQCTLFTDKAIDLNYQLSVVTKQIKDIQREVCDKIKRSSDKIQDDIKGNEGVNTVVLETRSFVKEGHNDLVFEDALRSFLEGDHQAEQLNQNNRSIETTHPFPITFKDEPNNLDDNPADDDDDYLSSSSSSSATSPPSSPSPPPKPKKSSKAKTPRRSRAKSKIDPNQKTRTFPIDKFVCNLCPEDQKMTFRYGTDWKAHLKNDHNTEIITCPEEKCKGLSFDKLADYLTHRQKTHLFKQPRKCEICGKVFKCLPTYYSHKTLKHGDVKDMGNGKGWVCDYCGKGLGTRNSLKSHLKYRHKKDINGKDLNFSKHVCEICGLEFKSGQGVKAHYRYVHERELVVTCHLCGKELKNKFNLKQHLIRKHKEEAREELEGLKVGGKGSELWRCKVAGCPRYYFEKGKLKEHRLEKHGLKGEGEGAGKLKERPFKCGKCGSGFWLRNKLWDHEKVHEKRGREDWRCGECGKGFAFKKYLRDHIVRMHKISREELDRREKEGESQTG